MGFWTVALHLPRVNLYWYFCVQIVTMHDKIYNTFRSFDKQNTFLWQNIWHIFEALICRTPYPYTVMNGAMYADSVVGKCFWAQCSWKSSPHLKSSPCFKHQHHSAAHMGCCCIMELSWATFGNRVLISTWQLTKQLVTPLWGSPLEEATTCRGRLIYNKVLMAFVVPIGAWWKIQVTNYFTLIGQILDTVLHSIFFRFGYVSLFWCGIRFQTSPDIGSKTDSGWYNGDICLVLKLI